MKSHTAILECIGEVFVINLVAVEVTDQDSQIIVSI